MPNTNPGAPPFDALSDTAPPGAAKTVAVVSTELRRSIVKAHWEAFEP